MPAERPEISQEQVLLAMAGDRKAVAELVRLFLPRVYGLCFRIAHDQDLAEEASQETFVRALRALPRLRRPESFPAWILMIAANTVKELRRDDRKTESLEMEALAAEASDLPVEEGGRTSQDAIAHALSSLEDGERKLFLLHTVEGFGLKELAAERNISLAAMKSHIHRLRVKVRDLAKAYLQMENRNHD